MNDNQCIKLVISVYEEFVIVNVYVNAGDTYSNHCAKLQ